MVVVRVERVGGGGGRTSTCWAGRTSLSQSRARCITNSHSAVVRGCVTLTNCGWPPPPQPSSSRSSPSLHSPTPPPHPTLDSTMASEGTASISPPATPPLPVLLPKASRRRSVGRPAPKCDPAPEAGSDAVTAAVAPVGDHESKEDSVHGYVES